LHEILGKKKSNMFLVTARGTIDLLGFFPLPTFSPYTALARLVGFVFYTAQARPAFFQQ
jgi:hypothetical protein